MLQKELCTQYFSINATSKYIQRQILFYVTSVMSVFVCLLECERAENSREKNNKKKLLKLMK